MRTSSTWPGMAPSTAIGPVRICPGSVSLGIGVHIGDLRRRLEPGGRIRVHFRTAGDGVDGHAIAAGDGEDRLQCGVEEAPMAGAAAGLQMMML